MREIDLDTAARVLESGGYNVLRRSAELGLSMFGGRWRLVERGSDQLTFRPVTSSGATLPDEVNLALGDVARITWDRLAKQEKRSQVRFHFHSGELWTFSGTVDEALLG